MLYGIGDCEYLKGTDICENTFAGFTGIIHVYVDDVHIATLYANSRIITCIASYQTDEFWESMVYHRWDDERLVRICREALLSGHIDITVHGNIGIVPAEYKNIWKQCDKFKRPIPIDITYNGHVEKFLVNEDGILEAVNTKVTDLNWMTAILKCWRPVDYRFAMCEYWM